MLMNTIVTKLTSYFIMRYLIFFLLALISNQAFALYGEVRDSEHLKQEPDIAVNYDNIQALDALINIEEKKLTIHKRLKELLLAIETHEEIFAKEPNNKNIASLLVTSAREALQIISSEKLEHLFTPDLLNDLRFYSSIAGKYKPPMS